MTLAPTAAPRRSVVGLWWSRERFVRRALAPKSAKVGVSVFMALVAVGVGGRWVSSYSDGAIVGPSFGGPSWSHPLGTDYLGEDVLARFLYGGRDLILLSLLATALGYFIAIPIGLLAGYTRGSVDMVSMRLLEIALALPAIVLVAVLLTGLGSSAWVVVAGVTLVHVPRIARITRAATEEVAARDFVDAAQAAGERPAMIMFGEILPNITSPLFADVGIRIASSVLLIASLNFLGFGAHPPQANWGVMVEENRAALSIQPWPVVAPALAIAALTISLSLVSDGCARAIGRSGEARLPHPIEETGEHVG